MRAARARVLARYNELVEQRQARHIGDIIREREDIFHRVQIPTKPLTGDETGRASATGFVLRPQKLLRSLLGVVLDVLATIGWIVTLPFITHDGRARKPHEQSRG